MNIFENAICGYYTPEQMEKIQHISIGIAGAGGIGSNCASLLVRCGFRCLTIADFDVVVPSNLNRQLYTLAHIGKPKVECLKSVLMSINPDLSINTVSLRVCAENVLDIFGSCDVVIEAFDCAESKAMLFSVLLHRDKVLVGASGVGGYGDSEKVKVFRVSSKTFIVGDKESEVNQIVKPFAPKVSVASAMMVDTILDCILN